MPPRYDAASRTVTIEVEVRWPNGRVEIEESEGQSARHALWRARDRHRGEAHVTPVDRWIL